MSSPTLSQNVSHTGDLNASYALVEHRTLTSVEPLKSAPRTPPSRRSTRRHIPLHNTFRGFADARNECSIAARTVSITPPLRSPPLPENVGAESGANAYVDRNSAFAYAPSSPTLRNTGCGRPLRAHISSTSSCPRSRRQRAFVSLFARARSLASNRAPARRRRLERPSQSSNHRTSSVRTRSCVTASANGAVDDFPRARTFRPVASRRARFAPFRVVARAVCKDDF